MKQDETVTVEEVDKWLSDHAVFDGIDSDTARIGYMARLAATEIPKLRERLECDRVYDADGNLVEVEPGSIPDGIECRDDTIDMQKICITKLSMERSNLEAQNARLREALTNISLGFVDCTDCVEKKDVAQKALAGTAIDAEAPDVEPHEYSEYGSSRQCWKCGEIEPHHNHAPTADPCTDAEAFVKRVQGDVLRALLDDKKYSLDTPARDCIHRFADDKNITIPESE